MRFRLGLFLLALPLIEIAGFVVVGRLIGVVATLGLVLLSGVVGANLMRLHGLALIGRMRAELAAGRMPAREAVHGLMALLAGLLLLLPGFVSDIAGLLLFIPTVRELAWTLLRNRLSGSVRFATKPAGAPRGGPATIDLNEGEFVRDPGRRPPRLRD